MFRTTGDKLPAAQNTSETLLSVSQVAVFVDRFRGAFRTLEIECFIRHDEATFHTQ